jgi:hypothetical protein
MTRQAARPLCLVAVVVICALAIAATGAPALAGGNPANKIAIHLKAHPTSCTKGYPTFTKCENINTTWASLGDLDAMPVFYDLVGYSVTEFGLTWPWIWGSCSWIRCKGDIAVGTIYYPGDGTSIAWTTCQTGWGIAPGAGWLIATEPGMVCPIPYYATGDYGVVDCSPSPGPYYDYPVTVSCGGVGMVGDDPCRAVATESSTWGEIKSMFR